MSSKTPPLYRGPRAFSASPLDRNETHRNTEEKIHALRADPTARAYRFHGGKVAMHTDGAFRPLVDGQDGLEGADIWAFLGVAEDGAPIFAVDTQDDTLDEGQKWVDARSVALGLGADPDGESGIVAQAKSLLDWHTRHQFCSNCGAPTRLARGGYVRVCEAAECDASHFPRVDPVVIMLVVDADADACLLVHHAKHDVPVFSCPAGFIEPGETIEAAVTREVAEETGILVDDVRYVASQPWPFPSSLMVGCCATKVGGTLRPDPSEISEARWVTRADVAAALQGKNADIVLPPPLAIAHSLLSNWIRDNSPRPEGE